MTRLSTIRQVIGLAGWLLLSFAAGWCRCGGFRKGEYFLSTALTSRVERPIFTHGNRCLVVWRQRGFRESGMALWLFIAQLTANALWSW